MSRMSRIRRHFPDTVVFRNVKPVYSTHEDILVVVEYEPQHSMTEGSKEDYIGIFPADWSGPEDCLCYVPAPRRTSHTTSFLYTVLFKRKLVQTKSSALRDRQFLYISPSTQYICGVSSVFTLKSEEEESPEPEAQDQHSVLDSIWKRGSELLIPTRFGRQKSLGVAL